LSFQPEAASVPFMDESVLSQAITIPADRGPADIAAAALTPAGQAALATAQALAKQAIAPATLRAYKADWTHFARWCAAHAKAACRQSQA
jgi:hypothetical protein